MRTSTLSVRSAQDLGVGEPLVSTAPIAPARAAATKKPRAPASTTPVRGPVPGADEIIFLPLGGCNRIGMNMTLYGHAGKWLIVDAGVAFGGDDMPEVQSFMVDPAFIEERMNDVVGLVVTHAHEDHIGAIHHLWPRLTCPIYATPFATHLIRERLKEAGAARSVQVNTMPIGGRIKIGPFDIETIAVTHSIPEPVSLAIRTKAGNLLHTGDWKFDPEPLVGQATDFAALKRLGDEGVLAMVCDSTNAEVEGTTGSEGQARAGLIEAFRNRKGAIAVTCFASNVARMKAVAMAAAANDRKVVLAGRSLLRMEKAARACGYLDGLPPFLSLSEASSVPRRNLVLICTGSQGEERSALSKIARAEHRSLALQRGDTVIFSARTIPGNEPAIEAIYELLKTMGVTIVTPSDAPVHVSGHPARGDLTRMYELVRPRFAVPVHGEIHHLEAHARLARGCGVERALVPEDGDIIRLADTNTAVVGHIEPDRLVNDGQFLLPWAGSVEATFGIRAEQRAERRSTNSAFAA
ncbi:beta-lactamase [Skermanella stibiiresistens SB22]|uniref:Beta-lactamase n=1 Tax=Skermanella stibiiresistens SB22 TaxID=1385369 RepID=W9H1H4_9PROT|nr:ribonuclease J [Skermanella stibiiresistens]EWY37603.1 beta-lactamase [Skermanella stibiiresistens SB22]